MKPANRFSPHLVRTLMVAASVAGGQAFEPACNRLVKVFFR